MVGVPRSGGCSLCLRRRVKCDETRPACSKCKTYGMECPGYVKETKFVVQAHRRRRRTDDQSLHVHAWEHSNLHNLNPNSTSDTASLENTGKELITRPKPLLNRIQAPLSSPLLQQSQCLSIWIADVSRTHSSTPDIVIIPRWLHLIPERLGKSSALDDAVQCVAMRHLGRMHRNQQLYHEARSAYGQALFSLQKAVYDSDKAATSETLCAAMMLCMYELFEGTESNAWMKHADGVRRLMEFRGVERHKNEFDRIMLTAFMGILIMEALFSGKKCFLDSPEWQSVTAVPFDESESYPYADLAEQFSRLLAACPGLFKEIFVLAFAGEAHRSDLIRRALELQNSFNSWFVKFNDLTAPPEEVISSLDDPLYPMVYSYCNAFTASLFCGYYASMIILYGILKACRYVVDYGAEIAALLDKICMSVEYMYGTGIMGAFRVGFSLRVAYELASTRTRIWIRKWLERFNKNYDNTSVRDFPDIEAPSILD